MDKSLWGSRVQAPFGARVLWFVCCAPNHGFGPQSGLVQRGVLYAAAWGSENHATALTGEENAIPLWWLAPPPCPVGSMSLDSRVAGLPYESSSFATPSSRWHNKAPRFYLFISGSTLSTGCSAPRSGNTTTFWTLNLLNPLNLPPHNPST